MAVTCATILGFLFIAYFALIVALGRVRSASHIHSLLRYEYIQYVKELGRVVVPLSVSRCRVPTPICAPRLCGCVLPYQPWQRVVLFVDVGCDAAPDTELTVQRPYTGGYCDCGCAADCIHGQALADIFIIEYHTGACD